jgi:hypothetical protein
MGLHKQPNRNFCYEHTLHCRSRFCNRAVPERAVSKNEFCVSISLTAGELSFLKFKKYVFFLIRRKFP